MLCWDACIGASAMVACSKKATHSDGGCAAMLVRIHTEGALVSDNRSSCSGSGDGRPHVQTASEADGVLGGIMRARVLSACQRLAIPVQERAPVRLEREAWQEAFLTNRRAQPWRYDAFLFSLR